MKEVFTLTAMLLVFLIPIVVTGLRAYKDSRNATLAHREYLLGNGATLLESLMPSVRRALRAAADAICRPWTAGCWVWGVGCWVLAGGSLWQAVGMGLLLLVAGMAVSVLVLLLVLWVTERRSPSA